MKTRTIKTYEINELAPDIRAHVLDKYRYLDTEITHYEFVVDYWVDRLTEIGFLEAQIYFDGFGGQGDGAVFEAVIDDNLILNNLIMCSRPEVGRTVEKCLWAYENGFAQLRLSRISTSYNHKRTAAIQAVVYSGKMRDSAYWTAVIDDTVAIVEELRIDLCEQIYADLASEHEWLTSDKCITESLEGIEFMADGRPL